MKALSEKVFLDLQMPTEEDPRSDQVRILDKLQELGYTNVTFPLEVLRRLYPLCRSCGFRVTVTLVYRQTDWVVTAVEPGDCRKQHYALAVDYGSTTIHMQLVDMNSGAVVSTEKAVNGQTAFGTDILTRITFAMEAPEHMDRLQKATVETFSHLLAQLTESAGIASAECPLMIISGNTTMIHFLLKLDAWPVFASPFSPVSTAPGFFWGKELGLEFAGLIYIIPSASNYVGGDIVSGLLTLNIHKKEKPSLFFDIGTNGELVLGNRDWLMAGAGAAGPALEGYISRHGMRASDGAIDSVKIQKGQLTYTTIGNQKPRGICGSGIIDLLAQMRLHGWVNIAGELEPSASSCIRYLEDTREYGVVYASREESASGECLAFTQTDINQYLDTKAAAYTMVECLLETAGISPEDLDHVYLSGAFPAHSDLEAAITIGIFPDLPREKYTCIANTSLEGARLLLLDRSRLSELRELSQRIYCVQFASIPDFLIRMQAAKFIPHTDMDRYPSVRARLEEEAFVKQPEVM